MSKKLYEESNIEDIADAIREQNGTQTTYRVAEMPTAIRHIVPVGNFIPLDEKGAAEGVAELDANGKVPEEQLPEIAPFTELTWAEYEALSEAEKNNGTYYSIVDRDNVPGAVIQPLSVTQNDIYNPPSGVDGYAPVTVNVSGGGDILTGTDVPSTNLGSNGDIYKRTFPLPTNVNFVEYLESTGTQYIDTGIYPTEKTDAFCRCKSSSGVTIFAVRTGSAVQATKCLMGSFRTDTAVRIVKAGNSAINMDNYDAAITSNSEVTFTTKTYDFAGTQLCALLTNNSFKSISLTPFTAQYTLLVFGGHLNSSTPNPQSSKIYRFVLYESGVPVLDYLPCLDPNGVACMWDNIAQVYVYNDGTGDFLYGNTASPTQLEDVYYLKANGTWTVIKQ